MDPQHNPYAPPADHAPPPVHRSGQLYSSQHVLIAAFIGSPLAACWCLAQNDGLLNDKSRKLTLLIAGVVATVLLLLLSLILPENFPAIVVPLAYSFALKSYADHAQGRAFADHVAAGGAVHSGWRAAGVGLLGLLATVLIVAAMVMVLPESMLPAE